MMEMFRQYFKIIGNTLVGIAFGFACFYIILNLYHYSEIRRTVSYEGSSNAVMVRINNKISMINTNISSFNPSSYRGSLTYNEASKLKNKFNTCVKEINNETFNEIKNKNVIDIRDVYNLRESYENNVASKCLVNEFVWLTNLDSSYQNQELVKNKDLYTMIYNDLLSETDYVKRDLMSNSNYYFSTDISLLTGKNLTRDSFYQVLSSYDKALDFILELSEWYKGAVTNREVVSQ